MSQMPDAPSRKDATSSRACHFGLAAVAAGISLGTPLLLVPSAAHAASTQLFYSFQQNSPVPGTGTLDDPGDNWWVKAVVEEVTGGIKIDFTSNFSDPNNFADDFVFSLKNTLSNITVTCTAGTGTTCTPPPIYEYDPNGKQNFVSTKDWELALFTPPNPGGIDDKLSGQGDTISYTVLATVFAGTAQQRGLLIEDFNASGNAFSCTHMKGITASGSNPTSSRICTGQNPTPFVFPASSVPGPLPILGAAAAFGYSRKLRTRIQSSRHQITIS
jgi:hypothetical protein